MPELDQWLNVIGEDVLYVKHDPGLDEKEIRGVGEEAELIQQRGDLGDVQVVSGGTW